MFVCYYYYWIRNTCWKLMASNRWQFYAFVCYVTKHQKSQRQISLKNALYNLRSIKTWIYCLDSSYILTWCNTSVIIHENSI